ncbi:carbohydrate ABC transporter permease [Phytomonospora endophytica]|uniref:Multiple sugar transport system permease protein n=1 Tax=Phytomonospora endophytica TaxID=714109 RepID=A0A841FB14_9ACTN|nr:carbohydrate ABC transporter permease [Phytomonospora endophytica]MBB6033446.1 multiple sugar transport system permease protein [Phytomonospora endophytica]
MSTIARRRVNSAVWYVAVTALSLATVFPLIWTLATSFKGEGEILGGSGLLPRDFSLGNYADALTEVPFVRYILNSLAIALAGAATNMFFGGLAGYAFAKLEFRFKRSLFLTLIASMSIPAVVTMIPLFLILKRFPLLGGNDLLGEGGVGFINSYWAVILPGAAGGFAIFFMRQFFGTLPDELGEAARIDGAGEFTVFRRVYLPLAKGPLAVLGLLTFQAGWNSFMWPLIVLNNRDMMTVQVGLSAFVTDHQTQYGPLMAGTVIASLPVLVVFLFGQRYLIDGIAHSGIK